MDDESPLSYESAKPTIISTVSYSIGFGDSHVFFVSSAELHLASYESEGPENHMEKDSRRSLRCVT